MLDHVRELIRYQEWADAAFFKRWNELPQMQENEEIRKLADHMTAVQKLFIDLLQKQPVAFPDKDTPIPTFVELRNRSHENHNRLKSFMSELNEDALSSTIHVLFFPGTFTPTVHEVLTQVVMHTQHHRAQNLQRLGRSPAKSSPVDWISWVYRGKPDAAWD
jgi:uncharacterized damage-inducible protein DinB